MDENQAGQVVPGPQELAKMKRKGKTDESDRLQEPVCGTERKAVQLVGALGQASLNPPASPQKQDDQDQPVFLQQRFDPFDALFTGYFILWPGVLCGQGAVVPLGNRTVPRSRCCWHGSRRLEGGDTRRRWRLIGGGLSPGSLMDKGQAQDGKTSIKAHKHPFISRVVYRPAITLPEFSMWSSPDEACPRYSSGATCWPALPGTNIRSI